MELEDMLDEKDIAKAIDDDPDVVKGKVKLAEAGCEYWKSIYPVEHDGRAVPPRPPGTGRDSIHVVQHKNSVSIACDDPIAHVIEYGSANVPEYAPRARTQEYFNKGGGQDRLET